MNAKQREQLEKLQGQLADIRQAISYVKDENQSCFDNLPEGLQSAEKGEKIQSAIDALESAENATEEVESYIQDAIDA